jgi:hypothetical protein
LHYARSGPTILKIVVEKALRGTRSVVSIGMRTMTNTTNSNPLFGAAYQRATRNGEKGNECACCGKSTNEDYFVAYEEQGFFPVGPECFKKLRKAGFNVQTRDGVCV